MGDNPTMTVTTDSKKRVVLPLAKPGDVFDVSPSADGKIVLTRLVPEKPASVRLVKKNGYTVAVGKHAITQEMVRQAMDEFP
jgi:hypothetical protein